MVNTYNKQSESCFVNKFASKYKGQETFDLLSKESVCITQMATKIYNSMKKYVNKEQLIGWQHQ